MYYVYSFLKFLITDRCRICGYRLLGCLIFSKYVKRLYCATQYVGLFVARIINSSNAYDIDKKYTTIDNFLVLRHPKFKHRYNAWYIHPDLQGPPFWNKDRVTDMSNIRNNNVGYREGYSDILTQIKKKHDYLSGIDDVSEINICKLRKEITKFIHNDTGKTHDLLFHPS